MNNEHIQTNEPVSAQASVAAASPQPTTFAVAASALRTSANDPSEAAGGSHPPQVTEAMQKQPYVMVPTNTLHFPRVYDPSDLTDCLPAPVSMHTTDDLHSLEEVAEIATSFRCAMKWTFEEGLRPKFRDFGGESRVYFKKVVDRSMGMHAFLKDIEVAHFPEWCIGHISDDDGYIRTNRKGWLLLDQYGNSSETKGGIANAREPFASCLHSIANAIYDINRTLCDEYENWLQSELGISDPDEILSSDQLYLAFENLMLKISEMITRIKNFTE